ncbi:unnamed protein product (macronuclear) [Paramecium tetraurelia]|uniref:Protein kinase domain-containing protein n=1 Tax=Paramecium tetraurelia TaxID=5888 RepID=A0CJM7_PARTE|nr:uncharacterized protein GSPATT00000706001 [Paramecium tetraurelia]CAK70994.1 unnamed protein product [Paramecium tetraurelia]|eukprot:XP_001438391.1 hypothetical protein (macronuclear) [Paramecium tetraurelia strain d4-2]
MNNYFQPFSEIKGYQIQALIGIGGFGQVYKAIQKDLKKEVAIKVIEKERYQENDGLFGKLVESEIKALQLVKSDHIIEFYEAFEDAKYRFIVLEYCDSGDLDNQLKNPKFKITEQDAIGIFKQILKGLRDLHAKHIIHRDLKTQNIMVHNNSIYKIGDLGFSKILDAADQKSNLQLGSLYTMAPEIFNQKPYGLASDMFSLGVIFYFILYNRLPFKQKDYLQDDQPNFNFEKNQIEVSNSTQDLLIQMLQFDPQKRITFQNVINHPAFEKQKFSMMSRIQLQANRIPFEDYQEFYVEKTAEIEQHFLIDFGYQQNIPQVDKAKQQPQRYIKISEVVDIQEYKANKLGVEVDKITQKINQMYYFSNTIQEMVQIFHSPNLIALLCLKLSQLCEEILKMIFENKDEYQNQQQYKDEFVNLELQEREMLILDDGIKFQLRDLREQLINFDDAKFAQSLSDNLPKQQFNAMFFQILQKFLESENYQITIASSHLVNCYLFCITENSQFLDFNEMTFNLNKSNEIHKDSENLLNKIQLFSEKINSQEY